MIHILTCEHFDIYLVEEGPKGLYCPSALKAVVTGLHTLFEIHRGNVLSVHIHYKHAGCEFSMTEGDYNGSRPGKHRTNPHIKMFMKQEGIAGEVLPIGYIIPDEDPEHPLDTKGCSFFFGLCGGSMDDEETRSFSCRYLQESVNVQAHLSKYTV